MPKYIQDPGDFQIALPLLAHLVAAVRGLQAWVMRSIATSTQRYKLWYSNFSDKPVGLTVPQKHGNGGDLLPPFLKWKSCFVCFSCCLHMLFILSVRVLNLMFLEIVFCLFACFCSIGGQTKGLALTRKLSY